MTSVFLPVLVMFSGTLLFFPKKLGSPETKLYFEHDASLRTISSPLLYLHNVFKKTLIFCRPVRQSLRSLAQPV